MNRGVLLLIAAMNFPPAILAGNELGQWTMRSTASVSRVRYCGGQFVAVGPAGAIITSSNGVSWTSRVSHTTNDLTSVAFGTLAGHGEVFVAVGYNVLLVSPDAQTWTNLSHASGIHLKDVVYSGGGRFLAVGRPTTFGGPSVLISPSPFAIPSQTNWSATTLTNPPSAPCNFNPSPGFDSIVRVDGILIAVGDICTGIWTALGSGTFWNYRAGQDREYFEGVAYGNGVAVAVGMEGPPFVSMAPFSTWTSALVNTNVPPHHFDNIVVGWDIAFGDGRFVVVGHKNVNVLESVDGITWTIHSGALPTGGLFMSVAYGAGSFVATMSGGIFQAATTGPRLAVNLNQGGPAELTVASDPGRSFGIEATSNLVQWTEIARGTNTSETFQFVDWSVTNHPLRFYRTVSP